MAKWYEIKAAAPVAEGEAPKPAEVLIYGNIGDRWNEDGVIASELVRDLSALEADTINLRINSYGGSVPDGLAIYNALRRHKATVNVFVDGVAISCASYIAMAGETITMASNAQMMIHAPWTYAYGNAVQLRDLAIGVAEQLSSLHDCHNPIPFLSVCLFRAGRSSTIDRASKHDSAQRASAFPRRFGVQHQVAFAMGHHEQIAAPSSENRTRQRSQHDASQAILISERRQLQTLAIKTHDGVI